METLKAYYLSGVTFDIDKLETSAYNGSYHNNDYYDTKNYEGKEKEFFDLLVKNAIAQGENNIRSGINKLLNGS